MVDGGGGVSQLFVWVGRVLVSEVLVWAGRIVVSKVLLGLLVLEELGFGLSLIHI